MADPNPYIVSYSFAGFQALNPNLPLPATQLDVQLAAIAAATTEAADSITSVRRADGNLQNGVVSWDSLSADVQERISNLDTRVTVGDISAGAFANQTEAETGVANDRLMTPLRSKQQLDALRAFASQAQAQAGAVNTVIMSPLRTADAITAQRPYATQPQAEAGTDNATVMTPLRTAQAVTAQRPFATLSDAQAGVVSTSVMSPLRTADAISAQRAYVTQPQAEAGTLSTGVMTPQRTAQAITAQRPFATQPQAEAGSDNTTTMTPLRTAQAIAALRIAFTGSASLTWTAISANTSATRTITVTGAAVGDRVMLGLPAAGVDDGLIAETWVSAANTVTVRLRNVTGGSITPHAGAATTYNATAVRF